MGENGIINIDLKPIADVTNNLINKLSDAAGWIATPKGDKARLLEAEEYVIEELKRRKDMPILLGGAIISNVRNTILQYTNQNDIIDMANKYLSESATPEGISDDWILTFIDYCKNASSDSLKIIWARILAEECNHNGYVPKKLLMILASISYENAMAFTKMCMFATNIPLHKNKDFYELLIFWEKHKEHYRKCGVNYGKLLELESMGLISIDVDEGYYISKEDIYSEEQIVTLRNDNKQIKLKDIKNKFKVGNVVFTDAGRALYNIIRMEVVGGCSELIEKAMREYNVIM